MASRKKKTVVEQPEELENIQEAVVMPEKTEEKPENIQEEPAKTIIPEEEKTKKSNKKTEAPGPKYPVGSIVYVSKDADADLNGFKLFPQYKKYTYTVEAYDEISGVYTLRRLNLSLRLKEGLILAPDERAHDQINRRQF